VVERRNRTLMEAARIMLIFSKAPMFLWAEAVATACYTKNRSFIHTRHNKTPYDLVHDKKPDLKFLRVFDSSWMKEFQLSLVDYPRGHVPHLDASNFHVLKDTHLIFFHVNTLRWWSKRKEFYITRHSAPSDRSTVRSHMRILSVVSLKTISRYGYSYLKEIVLRRAFYKEY
ncbi:retrovirus-related pol polyprotein from transposon TNT 1-94, partial [Tanacetum coccineum]